MKILAYKDFTYVIHDKAVPIVEHCSKKKYYDMRRVYWLYASIVIDPYGRAVKNKFGAIS